MKLGITGTRFGPNVRQQDSIVDMLQLLLDPSDQDEFHDGECIGVDVWAFDFVKLFLPNVVTVGHPPINQMFRANRPHDETRPAADYLVRNHRMVDEVQALIVVPRQQHEIQRSGTWATFRYAKKIGREVHVLRPHA